MGSLTVVEICLKMKTATTSADCKVLERMMKKNTSNDKNNWSFGKHDGKKPLLTKIINDSLKTTVYNCAQNIIYWVILALKIFNGFFLKK